jgi:phosphatidylglycerophosphatase A
MKRPFKDFLMSVGGLGHLRPAPGTWGSIPPVVLAGLLLMFSASSLVYTIVIVVLLVLSCIICVALGVWAEEYYGTKDPSPVVRDEVAGMCVTLLLPPMSLLGDPMTTPWFFRTALYLGACFVLFRIFDVIKPPPAYQLQKLPAGWGILVDDLVAGAMALGVVQLAIYFI